MKGLMKKALLMGSLVLFTMLSVFTFVTYSEVITVNALPPELEDYYELDTVYSTYASSTNYTIQGGMYSNQTGLAVRPKTTTTTTAGLVIPFDEDIVVTANSAIVLDVMFYNNQTRSLKVELVESDTSIQLMTSALYAYQAKDNVVVNDIAISSNLFNNCLNSSSGFATKDVDSAYNQLVIPLTSFGYSVGETASLSAINFYTPSWSTGTYDKYLFMGVDVSSDFATTGSFTSIPNWRAGVDSYSEYGTASTNLDIQVLNAGALLMDPSLNSSGSGVSQELVFKFPDELINESGYVETANLAGMTIEYLNETATSFNGSFKLYSTAGTAIANSNYSNLKTHKVTKDGTEANSNAKYFYNNTNSVGYADSFIRYNFDSTNAVTTASTESFYCSSGDLPTEISPYLTFSYDNSTTLSLEGVNFGTIRILTSDIAVYENTTSNPDVVTIDAAKGYIGNNVTYKATADERTVEYVTLNGVLLSSADVSALYSGTGLEVTTTGDMLLEIYFEQHTAEADSFDPITFNVISYFDDFNDSTTQIVDAAYGSRASFDGSLGSMSGYTFKYWMVNNVVQTTASIDSELLVTEGVEIKAMFSPTDSHLVMFMDTNGKYLGHDYVADLAAADDTGLTLPTKPGYVVSSAKWSKSIASVTQDMICVLEYEIDTTDTFTLTVANGTGAGTYLYNTQVAITAGTATAPQEFNYWEDSEGNIVSYQESFTITVLGNQTYTAVYSETPVTRDVLVWSEFANLRTGYYSYHVHFELPSSAELIEFGVITSETENTPLEYDNADSKTMGTRYLEETNEFLISLSDDHFFGRSYVIYKDTEGTMHIAYGQTYECGIAEPEM
jgi:hypothetical protein